MWQWSVLRASFVELAFWCNERARPTNYSPRRNPIERLRENRNSVKDALREKGDTGKKRATDIPRKSVRDKKPITLCCRLCCRLYRRLRSLTTHRNGSIDERGGYVRQTSLDFLRADNLRGLCRLHSDFARRRFEP